MARLTLIEFFGLSVQSVWDEFTKLKEVGAVAADVTAEALRGGSIVQPATILTGIANQAKSLFDIDAVDLLVAGWSKHRELAKYKDTKKFPPDETHIVPLTKHTMKIAHHPYLEVLLGPKTLAKVPFDVSMTFELEGFLLTIQNGKIRKVQTGTCQARGRIALKGLTLAEKQLTKIELPAALEFEEGIDLKGDAGSSDTDSG